MTSIFKLIYMPFLLLLCISLTYFSITNNSNSQVDESSLKAQWINDLIPYIKWKGRAYKEVTICIVGRENITVYLKEIIKKEMLDAQQKGKMWLPINVEKQSAKSEFDKCHILYIGNSEQDNISSILKNISGKQILTVSSLGHFADSGGIIEFILNSDGIELLINEKPAEEAKIVIDSDLLGFAKRVYK